MTLSDIETRLRDATYYANQVRSAQGEYSQAYRAVQRDIQNLTAMRNQMLSDIEYNNIYQQQSMGYAKQPAYLSQPLQYQAPSIARPYDRQAPAYTVPVFGSSEEANNKYASKTVEKPKYTIEYPVGNSEPEPAKKTTSKPLDGHEEEPIVSEGLEARKEENGEIYKWEIYGKDVSDIESVTPQELPKEIITLSTAQLFCKKNKTCCVSGVITKRHYITGKEGDDSAKFNDMFKSNILDALIKLFGVNPFINDYVDKYFTAIYNNALIGGVKRQQWITSLLEDLEVMQEMLEKDPAKKRAYMENIVSEINKDLNTNFDCKLTDGILELNHNIPFIYIDNTKLLGNLLSLSIGKRYAIREDSNPNLYRVIKSYLKERNKSYVALYAIEKTFKVVEFNVALDIYGNYIITR